MNKRVKEILDERKLFAENVSKKNLEQVFSSPKLKSLYQKETELRIQKAKAKALNLPFDDNGLLEAISQFNNALKETNLTRENLTPQYTCKKCADTGFIENHECECVKQIQTSLNLEDSQLTHLNSFENADYSLFDNENIKKTYDLLKKFCTLPNKYVFITLSGGTGVGKTFLLECVASEFIKQSKNVLFQTAFMINNDFLKFHTSFDNNKLAKIEKYLTPDILVIDDLGSEPFFRNVTQEYLYLVLNQRSIDKKITLISTNLSPSQLKETYGERCFSRIVNKAQNLLIKMENGDIRLKKQ